MVGHLSPNEELYSSQQCGDYGSSSNDTILCKIKGEYGFLPGSKWAVGRAAAQSIAFFRASNGQLENRLMLMTGGDEEKSAMTKIELTQPR